MTLVLGTCLADRVVMAADSKVSVKTFDCNGQPKIVPHGIARKLFKFGHVGVATYGAGPLGVHVPTLMDAARLDPNNRDVGTVVVWLQGRFKDTPGMHALVGGIEKGKPYLCDVSMAAQRGAADSLEPTMLVWLGNGSPGQEPAPVGVGNVVVRMLEILRKNSGESVGPPYEFLVIERDAG